MHGTVFAGGTAHFFLKDPGKADCVRVAHLAADEIELVVGLPDQAAGFLHAQVLAVAAEGRAADLAENGADVVGMKLQMLGQIGQGEILGKMGLNVFAGALDVGLVAGGDLSLNAADLQVMLR